MGNASEVMVPSAIMPRILASRKLGGHIHLVIAENFMDASGCIMTGRVDCNTDEAAGFGDCFDFFTSCVVGLVDCNLL